jgi:hypothetical protein
MNNFTKLAAIDVSSHIEKKGNLSYLSWAWAVDQLMRQDPTANWEWLEPRFYPDESVMVGCTVTAFEKPITINLPVMDNRNNAIKNPDARKISDAQMRCLVKAIACHGLGLYIYAGEDLPSNEMTLEEFTEKYMEKMQEAAGEGTDALRKAYSELPTNKVAKQFWEVEGDALILWAKGVDNG